MQADMAAPDAPTLADIRAEAEQKERQACRASGDRLTCYIHPSLTLALCRQFGPMEWRVAQMAAFHGPEPGATFALGRVYFVEAPLTTDHAARCYVWRPHS